MKIGRYAIGPPQGSTPRDCPWAGPKSSAYRDNVIFLVCFFNFQLRIAPIDGRTGYPYPMGNRVGSNRKSNVQSRTALLSCVLPSWVAKMEAGEADHD